jgi:hypothetical protein
MTIDWSKPVETMNDDLITRLRAVHSRCCDEAAVALEAQAKRIVGLEAEVDAAEVYAKKLYRERDEARKAVKRLAGALVNMMAASEVMHDPIVKRLVEGE